jgi:hypothetical protein
MASIHPDSFDVRPRARGIDLPVAILAAASVGFVAFAMPGDMFSEAVSSSGLPSLLPAAAPPLGSTARALVVAVAATATFAFVFLLLRLLDRKPAERATPVFYSPPAETAFEPEMPRLRRRDVHPDAPARRPILAARELGEPDLEQHEPVVEAEPEPVEEAQWEPVAFENLPEPEPEPEPEPVFTRAEAPPPADDDSITDLVARLERGLGRRQQPAPAQAPPPAPPPPAPLPEDKDDRLKSAIENLQRLATRG